jgi:hypothetical protein
MEKIKVKSKAISANVSPGRLNEQLFASSQRNCSLEREGGFL